MQVRGECSCGAGRGSEEEEEEGIFKANALTVTEEDPERDRAIPASLGPIFTPVVRLSSTAH